MPPDEQALFWLPELQPAIVLLTEWLEDDQHGNARYDWADLTGIDLRPAEDGWHALWSGGGAVHQLWFPNPPQAAADYAVLLPLDDFFELRAHAARRLWRALQGQSAGEPFNVLPDLTRERHVLKLRALDARLAGESYRTIAEVLFGYRPRSKRDWEIDPLKNKVRRLVADARRLMLGGYRALLHYPVKPKRRRD